MNDKIAALEEFHPQLAPMIELFRENGAVSFESVSIEQSRINYRASCSANGFTREEVSEATDSVLSMMGEEDVRVRIYRPFGVAPELVLPAILYIHGGGWVIGDLETHDGLCRALANSAHSVVVAVDYRLAPEHPFPASMNDCKTALKALVDRSEELQIDSSKLSIWGDSAGANMVAVLGLMAARGEVPPFNSQVLLYPVTDLVGESAGYERVVEGVPLTASSMRWFKSHYLQAEQDAPIWHHSPLRADSFANVPPAFIVSAGHDPLAEEAAEYAQKLDAEGIEVEHRHVPDHAHGIFTSGRVLDKARELLTDAVEFSCLKNEILGANAE